jgi:hypothetical protein
MCQGLAGMVVPALTSIGSAALNYSGNRDRAEAEQAAYLKQLEDNRAARLNYNAALDRQRADAQAAHAASLEASTLDNQQARLGGAAEHRIALSQPSFDQTVMLPGQGDASQAVRTSIVNAQNRAIASSASEAEKRAYLDAFGDADLGLSIALLHGGQDIDKANDFARGEGDVYQTDLNAIGAATDAALADAQNAGANKRLYGDLLGAAGTVGSALYGSRPKTQTGGTVTAPKTDIYGNPVGTYRRT